MDEQTPAKRVFYIAPSGGSCIMGSTHTTLIGARLQALGAIGVIYWSRPTIGCSSMESKWTKYIIKKGYTFVLFSNNKKVPFGRA